MGLLLVSGTLNETDEVLSDSFVKEVLTTEDILLSVELPALVFSVIEGKG